MNKVIAIIVMGSSLFTSAVFSQDIEKKQSDKKIAVGINLFSGFNEIDSNSSVDNDSSSVKLNVAYLFSDDWRVQGYFQHEKYNDSVYTGGENDSLNELGIDVIRSFDTGSKFLPFVQLGLGIGQMDLEGNTQSSATATSIKLGAGIIYKFIPSFEAVAGLDVQYRDWTDIQIGYESYSVDETSSQLYLGANFLF